ncbi:MAG: M48 family metallopeptidase [Fidelibacterota bacterium]
MTETIPFAANRTGAGKTYQRQRLLLSVTEFLIGLAFLIFIVASGGTLKLEQLIRHWVGNDYLVMIIFVTAIGLFEAVLLFPLNLASGFLIERHYRLSDQKFGAWFREQLKRVLVSHPLILIIITIFFALLRHYPQNWWIWLGIVLVLFSIILTRLAPVLIFPLFYKFSPLADKTLADKVAALCAGVGLRLEGVYQFNLSKTTRKANAAFTGIGRSKRVILGDTLLDNLDHGEILAVLAHELGHYKLNHIWKGMFVGTLLTFLGLYLASRLYQSALPAFHFDNPAQIAALPLIAVILTLYQFVTAPLQNAYSRANERAADDFAVRLTGAPQPLINGLNKLAEQNLSDRTPHPLVEVLFYSHPSIDKRIDRLM